MAGSSDRLNLYLAGGGSSDEFPDEVIDVDRHNDNFRLIDAALGAPGYTSTSRPPVPFDGQLIWETDTERLKRWNPTTSQWITVTVMPERYRWANKAARDAATGMVEGDIGDQFDNDTRWRYNGTAWKCISPGMIPVIPTGVAGTGVTIDANGRVVFAAATNINIDGCFTDDFDNYRIILRIPSPSTPNGFSLRLRAAGDDNTEALYDTQQTVSAGGTTPSVASPGASSWATLAVGNRGRHVLVGDFFGPKLAQVTEASVVVSSADSGGTNMGRVSSSLWHRGATQFDGLSIIGAGSGTRTGTVDILGYNN